MLTLVVVAGCTSVITFSQNAMASQPCYPSDEADVDVAETVESGNTTMTGATNQTTTNGNMTGATNSTN